MTMACGTTTAGRRRSSSRCGKRSRRRFKSNRLVAAMDIKNEPRQATVGGRGLTPSWGTGDATDFAAMYTTVGNLIHEINPHLLIICEGLKYAGDLLGVATHPVQLERPGKVVYSMHDYSWFHPKGQSTASYIEEMTKAGGYVLGGQDGGLRAGAALDRRIRQRHRFAGEFRPGPDVAGRQRR